MEKITEKINENKKIDWEELCRLEPRLAELFNEAQKIRRNRPSKFRFNPENIWYDYLKPKMYNLVGMGATGEGTIKSSEAYDTAYFKIYDALRRG